MSGAEPVISTKIIGETDRMGKILIAPLSNSQPDSICRGCGMECDMEMATENEIKFGGFMTRIKLPCHNRIECIVRTKLQFDDIYNHIALRT